MRYFDTCRGSMYMSLFSTSYSVVIEDLDLDLIPVQGYLGQQVTQQMRLMHFEVE